MKLPRPTTPYRSDWLSRLKDLAVMAIVYLVVAGVAKLAFGQVIYVPQRTLPRWYVEGCYVDESGQLVCNSRMPRPSLPVYWTPPLPRFSDLERQAAPKPKSIYSGGPLPPRDVPAAETPKLPEPPKPQTSAEQAEKDAQGWTASNAAPPASPPQASPLVIIRVPVPVPQSVPGPNADAWRADIEGLNRSIDAKAAAFASVIDELPAKTARAVAEIQPSAPLVPLPQLPPKAPAVAQHFVEKVERTGYLEILAQILLVAGGSAATIGTGYGAWVLAGKAAIKIAGFVIRKHFANQSTASTTPTAPTVQRYEFDSVLKQSVPVGAPKPAPVVVQTPPTVTQSPADVRYVPIETDLHARAHAWASEQTARIYGDRRATAADVQTTHDSLIKQYLSSRS